MKLGNRLEQIHGPVPGYKTSLKAILDRVFTNLTVSKPYYRANWAVVPSDYLSPYAGEFEEGGDSAKAQHHVFDSQRNFSAEEKSEVPVFVLDENANPEDLFLRVEYQTIRRLPKSNFIVFSIHNYIDSLSELKKAPKAAAVLEAAIANLTPEQRKYRDMEKDGARNRIIEYLGKMHNLGKK